jgi:succinate dehydrogenase / fumarate reductase iron-sulfur subunit/antitoxin CptB
MDSPAAQEKKIRLNRLRWRSRRGLLELDLILTRFLAKYLERLSEAELLAYTQLLQGEDNDLLDYVNGLQMPQDTMQQQIVAYWLED